MYMRGVFVASEIHACGSRAANLHLLVVVSEINAATAALCLPACEDCLVYGTSRGPVRTFQEQKRSSAAFVPLESPRREWPCTFFVQPALLGSRCAAASRRCSKTSAQLVADPRRDAWAGSAAWALQRPAVAALISLTTTQETRRTVTTSSLWD
jgi:hypothetical protein